tara:strand:- start:62 stop:712 length:651 start_codon:yes stop_codon:yes gene_type:complete
VNFSEFKSASNRSDSLVNTKQHFFSSLFSNYVAFFLYKIGFSPNSVTLLFCITGLSSAFAFSIQSLLLGYLLWRLHIILDMADGDIARATKKYSSSADGFDKVNHILINLAVIFSISYLSKVNLFQIYFLCASFLISYLFDRLYLKEKRKSVRNLSLTKILIRNIAGFEGFLVSFILITVFQFHDILPFLFIVYSLSFLAMFFFKLVLWQKNNEDI